MKPKGTLNSNTMAVIGAGPVGCTLAAFLAKGGENVILCDINPDLIKPALDPGMTTRRCGQAAAGRSVRRLHPCRRTGLIPSDRDIPDGQGFGHSADCFGDRDFLPERNGRSELAKRDRHGSRSRPGIGAGSVMRAVVNYGSGLIQPGRVRLVFDHPPHYLQELDPETRPSAKAVAKTLTRSGLATEHTDQIVPLVWRKAVMNACMNPVCAVTGQTMKQALEDPIIFQLIDSLLKECIRVARANEIAMGWDYYAFAREYMESAGPHKPSMLVDVEQRRRTEIDFINGKFIEYGRQAGIETPFNITIRALVKALESRPG